MKRQLSLLALVALFATPMIGCSPESPVGGEEDMVWMSDGTNQGSDGTNQSSDGTNQLGG